MTQGSRAIDRCDHACINKTVVSNIDEIMAIDCRLMTQYTCRANQFMEVHEEQIADIFLAVARTCLSDLAGTSERLTQSCEKCPKHPAAEP